MCVYNESVGIIPVIISQWRDTTYAPRQVGGLSLHHWNPLHTKRSDPESWDISLVTI